MSRYLQFLRDAFNNLHDKNPDLALAALDRAENAYDPNDQNLGLTKEDLYLTRGSIYYEQKNFSAALKAFERALQENNISSEACAQIGKTLLQLGEIDNARVMLEWSVKYDPFNQKAQLLLQKITAAIEDGIMAKADDDLLTIAYADFEKKDFQSALEKVTLLEKHELEKYASILNFKGFIYLASQKNELARTVFEEAKRINPESSQAFTGLGELFYLEKKDYDAKKCFESALRFNKDNHLAMAGLKKVGTEFSAPVREKTVVIIEELLQKAFEAFEAAKLPEAIEKISLAESELRKRGDADPILMSRLLSFKGTVLLQLEQFAGAKAVFEEALTANPESSQACTGLAEIFAHDNDPEAAKVMFEWAIKLNPQNERAKIGLQNIPAQA
jgi:tetratricopeptide (TPR) repeat protein